MKLKEHLVARKVVKDEINRMIEDFQSKDPTLRDKEWSSDGKNYSFKQDVFNKTGIELTNKYITNKACRGEKVLTTTGFVGFLS